MGEDTIAAIATPAGRGGVGIVRISGPESGGVARAVAGRLPEPRYAALRTFRDAEAQPIDSGLLLWFPGPYSYTGEDVAELQGHGGDVVMQVLLQACLDAGARLAEPGEFTRRALLNDRIDLAQAEAVADLIDAGSRQAARAAMASLEGLFSERVHALTGQLTVLRTWVEAAIDFADEDVDFLSDTKLGNMLDQAVESLATLLAEAEQGRALRDGMHIVILGRPNVGKSSLLNALAASERAIVTDIPGTTRDVLSERILINGLPLHVTDTAGLRDSEDPVELEGIRRARDAASRAELVLLLIDDRDGPGEADLALCSDFSNTPILPLCNKCDLSGAPPGPVETDLGSGLRISATTGAGLDLLRSELCRRAGLLDTEASPLLARKRHIDALHTAREQLVAAQQQLQQQAGELAAEELRLARQALASITGEFGTEALLGEIFSSFCVGK